jgi:6-phospho-beta-glucosidase
MDLKIAVLGGASNYTPELSANLVEVYPQINVDTVVLQDPNIEKAMFIAEVSKRYLKAAGKNIRVIATPSRQDAIAGADFIIMQIRVGGAAARVRDERLPMSLGLIGNETTGAGGFICGLRSVTAALEIARDIERLAPNAWLMNLTNPAGTVTEAIYRHSHARVLGFCNIPINTQYDLAELFGLPPQQIRMDYFGLNHLSWVRGVYADGQELLQALIEKTCDRNAPLYQHGLVDPLIDPQWLRTLGMLPRWYNRYFYFPAQTLREDKRATRVGGEEDLLAEEKLQSIYATSGYNQEARQILSAKGGAQYYLPVLQVIDAMLYDKNEVVILDIRNGNAISDLPLEACVELPARVSKAAVEPLPVGPLPLAVRGLVQMVNAYEELTIQAAVTGDRGAAIFALMSNPLVGSYPKAKAFFKRALENERSFLPQFY